MDAAAGADDTGIDIERRLALQYAPASGRRALQSLWAVDVALGDVVAGSGLATSRQIKLLWWRDALATLDGAAPAAHPALEAAAGLVGQGVAAADLARLEECWAVLLSEDPLSGDDLADHAQRGALLFGIASDLLGSARDERITRAGEGWALVDLARRTRDAAEAEAALLIARDRFDRFYRWPVQLRPIGMLAVLAERDARRGPEARGSPARIFRMMRHRLTGR